VRLAAAYGLAVTGTMTITGVMMTWIFALRRKPWVSVLSALVTVVDVAFLTANASKIPQGGYLSLIIASLPLSLILIYIEGQKKVFKALRPMALPAFLSLYHTAWADQSKITGTGLFLVSNIKNIPPYVTKTMVDNGILYSDNILVSIITHNTPFGVATRFKEPLAPGLRVFEISAGYMERVRVELLLREAGIEEKTIFYGLEEFSTDNLIFKLFALIKRLSPTFVQFYQFNPAKMHGVVTVVRL
jgi:KUP system potassium uptake protein